MNYADWMAREKVAKPRDDRLTQTALRWGVFVLDVTGTYCQLNAQSRPYKNKAAAERLAIRLNQALPPGHPGYVVELWRD